MRAHMNPRVLVTQWPPKHYRNERQEWNPERFSAWVRYTMEFHQITNNEMIEAGMSERTYYGMRKGEVEPKNTTIHAFCKYVVKLSKANKVVLEDVLEAAYNAMKPYNQE